MQIKQNYHTDKHIITPVGRVQQLHIITHLCRELGILGCRRFGLFLSKRHCSLRTISMNILTTHLTVWNPEQDPQMQI
jgi:hypothetical protein